MQCTATQRDESILETLTLRLHVLTLKQAADTWWGSGPRKKKTASERLGRLCKAGLLERHRVNVHPMLALNEPALVWHPGEQSPELGPVAYRLRQRWTQPLEPTTVYIASRKAANQFGGFGGKFKHRTQITHDVHVAEIYVRMLREDPKAADRWQGEELLGKEAEGAKVPDAMLCDEDGYASRVIEFGGQYDKRRLEHFHRFCDTRRLSYELW